jgi:heme oxygenase
MQEASLMLTRLADETHPYHAAADGDRLMLMERSSARMYRSCLRRIYCFEQPVEAALARTPGFEPSLLHTHLKTTRLANDLRGLGVAIDNIAQPATAFDDVAQALGWLYVIHRNTLYHGLLLRQLKILIPKEIQIAGSYLAAFEGLAGARMREIGVVIDRAARRGNVAGRVVAGANEALRRQRQWYSVRIAARPETSSDRSDCRPPDLQ